MHWRGLVVVVVVFVAAVVVVVVYAFVVAASVVAAVGIAFAVIDAAFVVAAVPSPVAVGVVEHHFYYLVGVVALGKQLPTQWVAVNTRQLGHHSTRFHHHYCCY